MTLGLIRNTICFKHLVNHCSAAVRRGSGIRYTCPTRFKGSAVRRCAH
jgi:hypothetical protein